MAEQCVKMYTQQVPLNQLHKEDGMKLKIAENIREHRHKLKLSQEGLAERIGVSFQAVSKWERGETYPDLETLPAIASFFHITVDELIGANEWEEEKATAEIIEKLRVLDTERNYPALVETAENGLKRFPNNHRLMAWIVYGGSYIAPRRSIELGEYLMLNCKDPAILNWVRAELCYAYSVSGDTEKALALAGTLPLPGQSRREVLRDLLEGEALVHHILLGIVAKYSYDFRQSIEKLLPYYSFEQQIQLLEKCVSLLEVLFESDDDHSALKMEAELHCRMAELCAENARQEEAVAHLEKAFALAEKHDRFPYGTPSSSLLRGCEMFNYRVCPSGPLVHPYQELADRLKKSVANNDAFHSLKDSEDFTALLNKN